MREYKEDLGQEALTLLISDEINQILRANLYEVGLNEKELKRLRLRKRELREALNNCGIGDISAKSYVKDVIEDILVKKLKFSGKEWDRIISFEDKSRLTYRDKFDILMHFYEKEYKEGAFEAFKIGRAHV